MVQKQPNVQTVPQRQTANPTRQHPIPEAIGIPNEDVGSPGSAAVATPYKDAGTATARSPRRPVQWTGIAQNYHIRWPAQAVMLGSHKHSITHRHISPNWRAMHTIIDKVKRRCIE